MKVSVLHPATFKLDGGAMFGIIPRPLWSKKIQPDEHNRILMSLRVMLIEIADRKILIDTGIGDYHQDKFKQLFQINGHENPLITCLKFLEINSEQITDIILTHLHFDHVGGLAILSGGNYQAVFPKAVIHLSHKHYQYALRPTDRDRGSFQIDIFKPLIDWYQKQQQIQWLHEEEGSFPNIPELHYLSSHGHTPYQIHPYTEQFIYLADILPMTHHLSIPWVMGYDIAPGISTEDKKRIIEFVIKNDLTVLFEHDHDFIAGKISKNENQLVWNQLIPSQKEMAQRL